MMDKKQMKTVKKIQRHLHTFYIQQADEGFKVRLKITRGVIQIWDDLYPTPEDAEVAVKAYCKKYDIKMFADKENADPSKAGNPDQWRKAAERIAATIKGEGKEVWLEALGLTSMPATEAALKKAYRSASLKSHPDHGGSDEAQRKVTEAYNHLLGTL